MAFTSKITSFCMSFLLCLPALAMQTDLPKINVLADPSLSIAISKLARQFASEQGIAVTTAYAPSVEHAQSIESGSEADVFITANQQKLAELQAQGLLDVYSKKEVTKNRLSLATYHDNTLRLVLIPKLPLAGVLQRVDPEFSFIIGDPHFQSSGYYAMRALRNYEMAGDLEPHTLFIRSSMDMHRTIASKGGYGIMYQSEATKDPALRVLATFQEAAHSPILYYGMAVAGEQMDPSRRFIEYLTSEKAQEVFQSLGFESLTTYSSESGHLARGSAVSGSVKPL